MPFSICCSWQQHAQDARDPRDSCGQDIGKQRVFVALRSSVTQPGREMAAALQGGRSEHNYGWPETYSVMIHHAVSGCFTCRKIICFNLPVLQIHTEHHVLCKKVLWVAAQSLLLQQGLAGLRGGFGGVPPAKAVVGIPFQKRGLQSCLPQRRGSCHLLLLLTPCCPHPQAGILVPPLTHLLCPSLLCGSLVSACSAGTQPAPRRLLHSLLGE